MRNKERENETVYLMTEIYCRGKHDEQARAGRRLCPECQALYDYSVARTAACPMGERKTTCAKCPIHCYKPERREAIQRVMRYAGPRMALYHPVRAFRHLLGKN